MGTADTCPGQNLAIGQIPVLFRRRRSKSRQSGSKKGKKKKRRKRQVSSCHVVDHPSSDTSAPHPRVTQGSIFRGRFFSAADRRAAPGIDGTSSGPARGGGGPATETHHRSSGPMNKYMQSPTRTKSNK